MSSYTPCRSLTFRASGLSSICVEAATVTPVRIQLMSLVSTDTTSSLSRARRQRVFCGMWGQAPSSQWRSFGLATNRSKWPWGSGCSRYVDRVLCVSAFAADESNRPARECVRHRVLVVWGVALLHALEHEHRSFYIVDFFSRFLEHIGCWVPAAIHHLCHIVSK